MTMHETGRKGTKSTHFATIITLGRDSRNESPKNRLIQTYHIDYQRGDFSSNSLPAPCQTA
jgi:hypothetical protein